ncbi:MAG: uroporphyrinogen decarboxylase family protein, partial [Rhodothermia bacterium]
LGIGFCGDCPYRDARQLPSVWTNFGSFLSGMQPKLRTKLAFGHEEPDRVPIDYMANPGIDRRLKQYFGLGPDDGEALRERLHVDFRAVKVPYVGPELHEALPDRRIDMWGIHTRWVEHKSGGYWDYCDFPLQEADLETAKRWPMPDPDDFDYEAAAEEARRHGDFAVVAGDPGFADIINMTGMMRTMEQALIDLMTDEAAGLCLIDRRIEIQLEVLRRFFEAAAGAIDLLWIGEDLGTQIGPMLSPDLYRKHLKPRHGRFVDLATSYGIPVMFHSCGSSSWVFDELIELGVTVIDTLQPEARNMSPEYLKSRFGDRLSFHGCISTAGAVTYGTPDEVTRVVRETLEVMKDHGGYALAPTHWLQDNSPVENVVAMYEAAIEFGRYE